MTIFEPRRPLSSPPTHVAPKVRLLLIGEEPSEAGTLQSLLASEGYKVDYRPSGREGIEATLTQRPALILLCLGVTDMDGLDLCRTIREKFSDPILAVSPSPEETSLVRALDSGADDVLAQPVRAEELRARVRALLRRSHSTAALAAVVKCGELQIDAGRRKVTRSGEPISLTRTELNILLFLASSPGQIQSQEAILRAVWGPHHGEYVQTLRVHIGHIRQKLEADASRPRYLITEPGSGYYLEAMPADELTLSQR